MQSMRAAILICALLVGPPATWAGGPWFFTEEGTIVKWADGADNIVLALDRGGLGLLTNAQADALVANVLAVWNSVPECTVNLAVAGTELADDVDHTNFMPYLDLHTPALNPVIYDADGMIIDTLYGTGQRDRVLGVTLISPFVAADPPHLPLDLPLPEAFVILNGRILDGDGTGTNPENTPGEYESVIVHEFGHVLGLHHSQINAFDSSNDDQPTMFPWYWGGTATRSLEIDDVGWISALYPSSQFDVSFGSIAGQVLEYTGVVYNGYQGINVIARRVGGGRAEAGSCVSGYIFHGGYGPANLEGGYLIPGLPPGQYTIEVEEVRDVFVGGSGVGPVDPPVDFPGIAGPEFYDANESARDDPTDSTPVTVTAATVATDIDIILNTGQADPLGARHWSLFR